MSNSKSRWRIPRSRSWVRDILHYDRKVPTFAHDRRMQLGDLSTVRQNCGERVSWPVVFLKGYALAAREFPVLQQTYMRWLWPHLYVHPQHVGTVVLHREYQNEDWLFWGRFQNLETASLAQLQQQMDAYQNRPVEDIFRRQLRIAALPTPLRRICWWLTFDASGAKRCKRLGTFFLSTISGHGATIQNPPSMLTSGLTYGPIDASGESLVTVTYDHRLMDGHHIGRLLKHLESVLLGEIRDELLAMARSRAA